MASSLRASPFGYAERGAGQVASGTPTVAGRTTLLVLKAQFLPGNDVFTLYTNPTPGRPEPASSVVKTDLNLGVVSRIGIYSTGAFTVDEIRIGTTYADVVRSGDHIPAPDFPVLLTLDRWEPPPGSREGSTP